MKLYKIFIRKFLKYTDKRENKCYNQVTKRYNNHDTEGGIKMNFSALDVAKYVISERNKVDNPLSNLELQKTLYYIQGYFLKVFRETLFKQNIVNWRYGPVVVETYFRYNQFASNGINTEYTASDMNNFGDFIFSTKEKEAKNLLDTVIANSEDYSARELVYKTHSEAPWIETETDQIIPIKLMRNYFQSNNPFNIEV